MVLLKLVEQGNTRYLLHVQSENHNISLNLTDLKNTWESKLSQDEAVQKFRDDNSLIQSADKWISEHILTLIKKSNTEIQVTNIDELNINVQFIGNVSSLKTKMNFNLDLQSLDKVYTEITLPLLMVINELQFRQEKLLSLLNAKDVEIKEFKFEGGKISRRNAVTELFNLKKFDDECLSTFQERAKDIFNNPCSTICPILNNFYPELPSIVTNVANKEENVNDSLPKEDEPALEAPVPNQEIKNLKELKRKASESFNRTKRPKKSFKI